MSARDELIAWVFNKLTLEASKQVRPLIDAAIAEARTARDAEWLAALEEIDARWIPCSSALAELRHRMTGGG